MRTFVAASAGLVAVIGGLLALGGCEHDSIYVTVTRPAQPAAAWPAGLKTIDVMPLAPLGGSSDKYSEKAADMLADRLDQTVGAMSPGASAIRALTLKELGQAATLAGGDLAGAATAANAGKVFTADAVVFGTILVQQSEQPGQPPGINAMGQPIPPTLRRTATVSLKIQMVKSDSGQILLPETILNGIYDSELAAGPAVVAPMVPLRSMDDATGFAIGQAVSRFNPGPGPGGPPAQCYAVELANGKGKFAKSGKKLAEEGDYDAAARDFASAISADRGDHGSIYDLGVMKLLKNDLPGAKAQVDKAAQLKPSDAKYARMRAWLTDWVQTPGVQVRPATPAERQECEQGQGKKPKKQKTSSEAGF